MKKIAIGIGCLVVIIIVYWLIPSGYEIRNPNPQGKNIISFGDSLTYGTGAKKGMDYPSQLSRLMGMTVVNLGVPGDTTDTAMKRLDSVMDNDPRIVLITLGGNDLKNGVSREIAFNNLKRIVTRIQEKGSLVVLGGINIPFYGKGFGDAYSELARETGSVLIPNIFKGIWGKPRLMSDPIHPNSAGYTIMAQHFYEAVEPFL